MKNTNIEVEGGEILLQSKEGHYAVIPTKHRQKVMDMVDEGCDDCINSYIQSLPRDSDYAEDGTLVYQLYENKTGKKWNTAKKEGLTSGSYDDNMALRKRLLSGEFDRPSNANTSANRTTNSETFEEAFKKARATQGKDGKFEWNGQTYGTKYKGEENASMKKDIIEPPIKQNPTIINDRKIEEKQKEPSIDTPSAKPSLIVKDLRKVENDKTENLFIEASSKSKRPIIEDLPTAKPSLEVKDLKKEYSNKIDKLFSEALDKTSDSYTTQIVLEAKKKIKTLDSQDVNVNDKRKLIIEQTKKALTAIKHRNKLNTPSSIDKSLNTISDYVDNAEGYLQKLAMEHIPGYASDDAKAKAEAVVTEKYIAPKEVKMDRFKSTFNETTGYQGEVHKNGGKDVISNKSKTKIHKFVNAFDNKVGYDYTPIPNKGNHVDSTYNSPGVAHFLLDSDLSQKDKYQHEYSKQMVNQQLKGVNIQEGSTVKDQYFPIYTKTPEGKVNLKYKTKAELKKGEEGSIASPLRQYRFSDIDWDQKPVQAQGFNNTIVAVPTKQKDSKGNIIPSHLIYGKASGKGAYGDYSGTSVVFIVNKNGERLVIDYANSVENIQNKAKSIINSYDIKPEDLIIGVHDLGSFNAKPVGENNKLKYNPKTFNPHDYTGGAIAF